MNHLILCIESSTDICSVALFSGNQLIALAENKEGNKHSEIITILVNQCLEQAGQQITNLDAVAVSLGPGSYTSLRVGMSTAKGLCYALNIPLITIPSLDILAHGVILNMDISTNTIIVPMIDARRMEVYTSFFNNLGEKIHPENAVVLDETFIGSIRPACQKIIATGNGASKFQTHFHQENISYGSFETSAKMMGKEAFKRFLSKQFDDTAYAVPNYFKAPNITQPKK